MTVRFAFVGFRHPHIRDMYSRCCERDDIEVVACCETDQETREQLAKEGVVAITHDHFGKLLDETECDVVAVGDCYAHRGKLVEQALLANRHVISDKPLCVRLDELDRIEAAATERGRLVGMMLDMRDLPIFLGIRQLLQGGAIGELRAMTFDGQHPLLKGKRPEWYFEKGLHGGTINDIAVHAIDMIPWATGHQVAKIHAARCWNARTSDSPWFRECGQAMLELSNGAGVTCDVSYLTPDSFAYAFPYYWRFCLWGDGGTIVASLNDPAITLFADGETEARQVPLPAGNPGGYLNDFLSELAGGSPSLTSSDAISATRTTLKIQQAADEQLAHVELS